MNNYIFKYNKKGDLYNYCELNRNNKVLSYYNLENNKLIRYDYTNNMRHFVKYYDGQDLIMKHRFEGGESWITIALRPEVKKIESEEIEQDVKIGHAEYKHPEHYHWMQKNQKNHSDFFLKNTIYTLPIKEKEYIFEKDKIYKFQINIEKIEKWKSIVGFTKSNRTYPHIRISLKK